MSDELDARTPEWRETMGNIPINRQPPAAPAGAAVPRYRVIVPGSTADLIGPDSQRYHRWFLREGEVLVRAADHDAALRAKDERIQELEHAVSLRPQVRGVQDAAAVPDREGAPALSGVSEGEPPFGDWASDLASERENFGLDNYAAVIEDGFRKAYRFGFTAAHQRIASLEAELMASRR